MINTTLQILFDLGLTLGAGSSTFALIFFIRALEDGTIDVSEKRMMHTVYVVLRIGMFLLGVSLISLILVDVQNLEIHWPKLALLGVITLNAILMDRKIMPMKVGPIIAGGSWYSLFIVSRTPMEYASGLTMAISYLGFLTVFYFVYGYLRKKYTFRKTADTSQ